jgi:hypothetical protein
LVPQWDRNPDILATWIGKINHLANNLPEIKEELGKIVLRRFTPKPGTTQFQMQSTLGLKRTGPHLKRLFQNIG